MLNTPEFYTELGKKAAEARNQRDEARADFHARHFRQARNLESGDDRATAGQLYQDAYGANRRV